jgi:uncharacterized protein (DUF433 family)
MEGRFSAQSDRITIMYPRIVSDPAILSGKPVIRGTRISVEFILELFAGGAGPADVLRMYPQLTAEDVQQAARYAADAIRHDVNLPPRMAG